MTDQMDTLIKTIRKSVLQEESRRRSMIAKEAWNRRKANPPKVAQKVRITKP